MKVSLVTRTAGLAVVAALGLAACGSSSSGGSGGGSTTLTPQGSTFQQTLEQQWASQYQQTNPDVQVTYSGTGSSAGIEQFTAGKIPFAGSDVTMDADEQSAANSACGSTALTIPITSGGVAIIYNLQGVSNLQLSADTLAGIFMGTITKWDDPKIKADNPNITNLPATTITTFHRSDGSGTTNVLSGFLDATAKSVWTLGVNKEFNWPSGQGAEGSSGVVSGVKSTDGGITYAEITYAKQNNLPTAAVKGATGGFVSISSPTVTKSIQTGFSVTGTAPDLAGALDFTKMTGYPISTVSYVLVCSKYSDAKIGTAVKGFLTYAAGDGQSQSDALGFAPLPSSLDQKALTSIATIS